jgi:hypothetical protein
VAYRMGRGDFIPGYYRGDPGFLSGIGHFLGGVAGAVAHVGIGAVGGFLKGGPVGGILGAIGGTASAIPGGVQRETLYAGSDPSGDAARLARIKAHHAAALRRGGAGTIAARAGQAVAAGGVGPHGRRLNADGTERKRPTLNPFNPRALRRAARRAQRFLHMSRRLVRYYQPKAHKGKAYVHFKKRRAA